MTNNEMVLELLELIGTDEAKNAVVCRIIRKLLKEDASEKYTTGSATVVTTPAIVESVKETATEQEPAAPKKRTGGRKEIDMGKCRALLKAGWSIAKCADELGVSEPTLRKRLKEEGLLK